MGALIGVGGQEDFGVVVPDFAQGAQFALQGFLLRGGPGHLIVAALAGVVLDDKIHLAFVMLAHPDVAFVAAAQFQINDVFQGKYN